MLESDTNNDTEGNALNEYYVTFYINFFHTKDSSEFKYKNNWRKYLLILFCLINSSDSIRITWNGCYKLFITFLSVYNEKNDKIFNLNWINFSK